MATYYTKSILLLLFILVPAFAAESSLPIIAALPVEHNQTNAHALLYCYRWLNNQRLLTHKAGIHKRVWNISDSTYMRVTPDMNEWQQYSELVSKVQKKSDSRHLAVVDTFHDWNTETGQRTKGSEVINVYDTYDNFQAPRSFTVENGGISEISISPDSQWLAAYTTLSFNRQQEIHIWNIMRGYLAATLVNEHYGKRNPLDGQEMTSLENIWSPNGTKIATYNADGSVLNIRQLTRVFDGQR